MSARQRSCLDLHIMKTLLILRHAKSSHSNPRLDDHDRPLNKRGKADAPRVGRLVAEQGLEPDRILCSTARRARATVKGVVRGGNLECPVHLCPELYRAGPEDMIELIKAQPDDGDRVMIVGHNPGLEALLGALCGLPETLPTAGLAHLRIPIESWGTLDGAARAELVALWRPRELAL